MQSRLMRGKEFVPDKISLASAYIHYSFQCKSGNRNKVKCIGLVMTGSFRGPQRPRLQHCLKEGLRFNLMETMFELNILAGKIPSFGVH